MQNPYDTLAHDGLVTLGNHVCNMQSFIEYIQQNNSSNARIKGAQYYKTISTTSASIGDILQACTEHISSLEKQKHIQSAISYMMILESDLLQEIQKSPLASITLRDIVAEDHTIYFCIQHLNDLYNKTCAIQKLQDYRTQYISHGYYYKKSIH